MKNNPIVVSKFSTLEGSSRSDDN